jgi:hypothetical protein
MVDHGATTFWELWNGDTADPSMNSGNHVMLMGDLDTWLYEDLAGIRPDERQPGFKQVIFHPLVLGDLTWVSATHRGPYGTITSRWERRRDDFSMEVSVPPNSTATLDLPAADVAAPPTKPPACVWRNSKTAGRSIRCRRGIIRLSQRCLSINQWPRYNHGRWSLHGNYL